MRQAGGNLCRTGIKMLEEPPLVTINSNIRRPSVAQIAGFQNIPTGFVVDAMYGAGALDRQIQPVGAGRDIRCVAAGPALTADCGPADILALLASLNFIQNGDIVVSSFGGHQGCASVGDRVMGMIKNSGGAGLVTDGPARDYDGIVEVGLPLWCTGLTPASPFSNGPGRVGFAVQLGGQEVETGDMIIADRDGVVVVPFERIDETLENLQRVEVAERQRDKQVADGLKVPQDIVDLLASDRVKFTPN